MKLDEVIISKAIIDSFSEKFKKGLKAEVVIAGAGPAGLIASYYLAKKKIKVVLFERTLSVGGGMWGGGMMFNEIVVQKEAKHILDELGVKTRLYQKGYYLANSVEAVSTLTSKACRSGVEIFNLITIEDIMIKEEKVVGVVINWSAVDLAGLHVDPLAVRARFVVDATGHNCELARTIERKVGASLNTETGKVIGERPMWAEIGEANILKNTKEAFPNFYVAGMAANAVYGGPRMGPVFGGMLLSGQRVAKILIGRLRK